jgi:hypothetical protein
MAGGRWARQSYYEAIFSLALSILEDAECYMALKSHLQRVRHHIESDSIPQPRAEKIQPDSGFSDGLQPSNKLTEAIKDARARIESADRKGNAILIPLVADKKGCLKSGHKYSEAVSAYKEAFDACARVRDIDRLAFHADWFRDFYRRNYDALMIKSIYDNVVEDVDKVRYWYVLTRQKCRFTRFAFFSLDSYIVINL